MPLFGVVHVALLLTIAGTAAALSVLCQRRPALARPLRLALGWGLAVNEIVWWIFRYSHEGFRFPQNVPLQFCDASVWFTVAACLTLSPLIVEVAYFAGLTGPLMAILTPDLWSPWPSYPALYFFLADGGIVI